MSLEVDFTSVNLMEVTDCWCLTVFGCDTEACAWQFRSATSTFEEIGIRQHWNTSAACSILIGAFDRGWIKRGF